MLLISCVNFYVKCKNVTAFDSSVKMLLLLADLFVFTRTVWMLLYTGFTFPSVENVGHICTFFLTWKSSFLTWVNFVSSVMVGPTSMTSSSMGSLLCTWCLWKHLLLLSWFTSVFWLWSFHSLHVKIME